MNEGDHIRPESRFALAAGVRLQTDRITGDPLLLTSESVHILNTTGEEIVRRCDGQASVAEIVEALASEYEAEVEELRADILECLEGLRSRRLIIECS